MWKTSGVTVLVLVISLLSGCSSGGLDEGSARDTFTDLCNAVRDRDSSALYDMMSDDMKSRGSKEELMRDTESWFASPQGQKIDRCEIEAVTVQNSPQSDAPIAEGQIRWFADSGEQSSGTTTLIGENGAWKLQD